MACRQTSAKRQLIRLVREPGGEVELDQTGKRSGRGAYICAARACWEVARERRALEHALKVRVSREEWDKIMLAAAPLLAGEVPRPRLTSAEAPPANERGIVAPGGEAGE